MGKLGRQGRQQAKMHTGKKREKRLKPSCGPCVCLVQQGMIKGFRQTVAWLGLSLENNVKERCPGGQSTKSITDLQSRALAK